MNASDIEPIFRKVGKTIQEVAAVGAVHIRANELTAVSGRCTSDSRGNFAGYQLLARAQPGGNDLRVVEENGADRDNGFHWTRIFGQRQEESWLLMYYVRGNVQLRESALKDPPVDCTQYDRIFNPEGGVDFTFNAYVGRRLPPNLQEKPI
jgi:hypothetical protein